MILQAFGSVMTSAAGALAENIEATRSRTKSSTAVRQTCLEPRHRPLKFPEPGLAVFISHISVICVFSSQSDSEEPYSNRVLPQTPPNCSLSGSLLFIKQQP